MGAESSRSPVAQGLHSCAFFSRQLSPAEANSDVGNWELLAIVLALQMWRNLLEGTKKPFIEYTRALFTSILPKEWTHAKPDGNSYIPVVISRRPKKREARSPVPDQSPEPENILPDHVIVGVLRLKIELKIQGAEERTQIPAGCDMTGATGSS